MAKRASEYAKSYIDDLKEVLDQLSLGALDKITDAIETAYAKDKQIFVIGNGGSAATASHMMNDLAKGTLGHKGDAKWKRFRVIALTDNVSLMTAWANDSGFDRVFSEPLKNLARSGDLLIAISASGNSSNVIAAVKVAKQLKMKVVGLAGFGGGKLARLADVVLVVSSDQYGPVEDVHMILDHIITGYLYEKLRSLQKGK